jgi:hypothetical protein
VRDAWVQFFAMALDRGMAAFPAGDPPCGRRACHTYQPGPVSCAGTKAQALADPNFELKIKGAAGAGSRSGAAGAEAGAGSAGSGGEYKTPAAAAEAQPVAELTHEQQRYQQALLQAQYDLGLIDQYGTPLAQADQAAAATAYQQGATVACVSVIAAHP